MSDESHPRVLYVGNLGPDATEDLLMTLFAAFGVCKGCKIIHEAGNDLYAFIEFAEHREAQMALLSMNKRLVLGKELKVNWATSPGSTSKLDTSNHFHVFVGDLSPDIESSQLRDAFAPFGEISDCKVIRDPQTHRSKGYAFICFVNKEEAEMAIAGMNGQWLGGRTIRTNWATGKGNTNTTSKPRDTKALNYDEVFDQTSSTNTTVYCGGIQSNLTDDLMKETFGEYGTVVDCRVFKDKGYAFIKMDSKEAACNAICSVHGTEVGGYIVKCSWGKEMNPAEQASNAGPGTNAAPNMGFNPYMQGYGYPGYGYGGGPNMGYWGYGPQGPYPPQGFMPPQQQQQWGGYGGDYWGQGGPNNQGGNMGPPQNGGPNGPPQPPQGPNQGGPGGENFNNQQQQWNNQQPPQQWNNQNQQWNNQQQPQQWKNPQQQQNWNNPQQQQWGNPNQQWGNNQQQWGNQQPNQQWGNQQGNQQWGNQNQQQWGNQQQSNQQQWNEEEEYDE